LVAIAARRRRRAIPPAAVRFLVGADRCRPRWSARRHLDAPARARSADRPALRRALLRGAAARLRPLPTAHRDRLERRGLQRRRFPLARDEPDWAGAAFVSRRNRGRRSRWWRPAGLRTRADPRRALQRQPLVGA